MTEARDLADRFHERWLHVHPFAATMYGIPGYDHLLPDDSEAGQQAWRAEAEGFVREADAIDRGTLSAADAVTLDCTRGAAAQEVAAQRAIDEHALAVLVQSLADVELVRRLSPKVFWPRPLVDSAIDHHGLAAAHGQIVAQRSVNAELAR